jgi:hypothetical protein
MSDRITRSPYVDEHGNLCDVPRVNIEPSNDHEEPVMQSTMEGGTRDERFEQPSIERSLENIVNNAQLAARVTPHVITIIRGMIMKNWKTTLSGLVTAGALFAKVKWNIDIPTEGIVAVGLFLIGYFSKDHNVTGGNVEQ